MNRRTLITAAAAALVVALAAYGGLWVYGAHRMQALTERWAADLRAEGWLMEMPVVRTTGFPGTAQILLPSVRLTAPPEKGGWTWWSERALLRVRPWRLDRPELHLHGTQVVELPTGETWEGRADAAVARFRLSPLGRTQKTEITVTGLEATSRTSGAEVTLEDLTATLTQYGDREVADYRTTTYRLVTDLSGLTLPLNTDAAFSPTVRHALLEVRLVGPLPNDLPLPETLVDWKDAGGAVEIDRMVIDWPPLMIGGSGTVALDEQMQPVAAFSARLSSLFETIESLERSGTIRRADATMARVVLGMAATRGNAGEAGANLPITIQNRKLSVGPVSLLELPMIVWGQDPQPSTGGTAE